MYFNWLAVDTFSATRHGDNVREDVTAVLASSLHDFSGLRPHPLFLSEIFSPVFFLLSPFAFFFSSCSSIGRERTRTRDNLCWKLCFSRSASLVILSLRKDVNALSPHLPARGGEFLREIDRANETKGDNPIFATASFYRRTVALTLPPSFFFLFPLFLGMPSRIVPAFP